MNIRKIGEFLDVVCEQCQKHIHKNADNDDPCENCFFNKNGKCLPMEILETEEAPCNWF